MHRKNGQDSVHRMPNLISDNQLIIIDAQKRIVLQEKSRYSLCF